MTQCIKELPITPYGTETYRCQRKAGYGLNGMFCQKHANMQCDPPVKHSAPLNQGQEIPEGKGEV